MKTFTSRISSCAIFTSILMILFAGFYLNIYKVADGEWFYHHQRDSEALVVARLIEKTDRKLSSSGSLLMVKGENTYNRINEVYDLYLSDQKAPESRFFAYSGQFGLQGHIFSLANFVMKSMGLPGKERFDLLQIITALSLAATLAFLLVLFRQEFGLSGTIIGLPFLVFSPWLTVFARNLYWVPFTWFLPIVAAWWYYVTNVDRLNIHYRKAIAVIGALFLIKCLCGLEYITAIGGSIVIILAYGLIRKKYPVKTILINVAAHVTCLGVALAAAMALQVIQNSFYQGSIFASISDILSRIAYRSYGTATADTGILADSLNSGLTPILQTYWAGSPVINATDFLSLNASRTITPIILIVVSSGVYLLVRLKRENWHDVCALSALAIGSVIASISWFIVGKGHSYIHTHMNYVLWHVSALLLLGPVCVGFLNIVLSNRTSLIGPLAILLALFGYTHVFPERIEGNSVYARFDTSRGEILLTKRGVYLDFSCKGINDYREKFFLHINIPGGFFNSNLGDISYVNMDFYWDKYAVNTRLNAWVTGRCTALVPAPSNVYLYEFPISSIRFGQFRASGDMARIWEDSISENKIFSHVGRELLVEDFSDYQWENGYHLSKNGFFVTNTFANRQAIGASKGIVVSGMHVEFDEVIFGERWITFFFNDAPSLRQAGNRAISLY